MLKQPVSGSQDPAREREAAKRRQNTARGANPGIPGNTTDIRPEGAEERRCGRGCKPRPAGKNEREKAAKRRQNTARGISPGIAGSCECPP